MKHLTDNNTTYWKHLRFALFISLKLSLLSVAGAIHAVIPYLFKNTVSNGINDVDGLMAEQIGKLEIDRPLHNELKKRLFMIDKHLRPIAQAMETFQKETGDPDFRDPEEFDITQYSPNE